MGAASTCVRVAWLLRACVRIPFPSISYMSDHGSPPPGGTEPSPPPGDDAPDGLVTPGLGAGLQYKLRRRRRERERDEIEIDKHTTSPRTRGEETTTLFSVTSGYGVYFVIGPLAHGLKHDGRLVETRKKIAHVLLSAARCRPGARAL